MKTPTLEKCFENEAQDMVEAGMKSLQEDWKNTEQKACKVCQGTGIDPVDLHMCYGCDGTGVSMVVEYGVSGGQFYSRITERGIDRLKDLCAAYREQHRDMGLINRANASMQHTYLLPEAAKMELTFMYPEFEEMVNVGDHRSIAKLVQKHYPEFLTTSHIQI